MFQTWESYAKNIYKNTLFLHGHGDVRKKGKHMKPWWGVINGP